MDSPTDNSDKPTENVISVLLNTYSYIIIISGLPNSPIDAVINELSIAFDKYCIVLDFMHLPLDDTSNIINERLSDIVREKKRVIIVKCKTFIQNLKLVDTRYLNVHINISINDKMINDDMLAKQYKELLQKTKVNKYFNYKGDDSNLNLNLNQYISNIFYFIIDIAEKRLYGDKYEEYKSK